MWLAATFLPHKGGIDELDAYPFTTPDVCWQSCRFHGATDDDLDQVSSIAAVRKDTFDSLRRGYDGAIHGDSFSAIHWAARNAVGTLTRQGEGDSVQRVGRRSKSDAA